LLVAACGAGPIINEAQAIALAKSTSGLSEPIEILEVEHGKLEELMSGPRPRFEEPARLARPSWRVVIRGVVNEPCADSKALLPCGVQTLDLVFDEATGDVAYSIMPG
jgi:hypothetical protein